MSNDEDKSSKTEEASEKKLADARKKGDVASSREVGSAVGTFSLLIGLIYLIPFMAPSLSGQFGNLIEMAPHISIGTHEAGLKDIGDVTSTFSWPIIATIAPFFGVMVAASIVGVLIQGETVVATERMKPKVSNISPMAGFKRIFSVSAMVELLKNVTKVAIIGGLALFLIYRTMSEILPGGVMIPDMIPNFLRTQVMKIFIATICFMIPITLADVAWKRFEWAKKQRMSLKDIKDENKDADGSPEMKQKRARIRFERANQRIAERVPTANLILTNPTHYAIALKYERGIDVAPVCVAKGVDLMAAKIRELARENNIPVIENRPLARALHASVEIDQVIPGEHWEAVAQIVGYVMDLKRKVRRAPPKGSELRLKD